MDIFHGHLYLFLVFSPKAWKKYMLYIRTYPFKVHSLVKGRETCKLAFTVQHNKGYEKGIVKYYLFQGR